MLFASSLGLKRIGIHAPSFPEDDLSKSCEKLSGVEGRASFDVTFLELTARCTSLFWF